MRVSKTYSPKKTKSEILAKLSRAIVEGNEEESKELSRLAIESSVSIKRLLKSCYKGLKIAGSNYWLKDRSIVMMAVEAFLAALGRFRGELAGEIKAGTILLSAMESDGRWAATACTLPLLEAFGHKVYLVASYYPELHIKKLMNIRPSKPDIICITAITPGGKSHIRHIVNTLRKSDLCSGARYVVCNPYFKRTNALHAGYDAWTNNYLELPEMINELI